MHRIASACHEYQRYRLQHARDAAQRALRERFAIEVADGEDAVLRLAVILVIETIRAARQAAASGG